MATATVPVTDALDPRIPPVRRAESRRQRRELWHIAAVAIVWGTSLVIVAIWLGGGGAQAVLGPAPDALNSLGRLAGLVAANLMLYQVLLMARVPVFERGFGRAGITRLHRAAGFWSFWLMLLHIALLVVGYALGATVSPLSQLLEFVVAYPWMWLAGIGTLLLILVVATSIRAARRRGSYERWYLIHLLAYVGVFTAVPHMLANGVDFTSSAAAAIYWWGLWIATVAAVLVFRVAAPVVRSAQHRLRVVAVEPDGVGGVAVRMRGQHLHRLGTEAGQFFHWRFLHGREVLESHPYSLAAAPSANEFTIAVKVVGDGTARVASLPVGTRVAFEGPFGTMTGAARQGHALLMFGAGAGVAPLIALLESEPYVAGDAVLVTRDHSPASRMRSGQIGRLVTTRKVRHFTLDGPRARRGASWLPTGHENWDGAAAIRALAQGIALDDADVFLCGPDPWVRALERDLARAGVARDRIHSESFAH
ncbi:ferredoxin reductase family protein [Gulosibacter sp. ACHW.36C]|uniref:Ferredoxin reductase family protein n=1 Tax=Gulosibacter sediminis TaxID=1729695 RepID=A0ABY4N019_9MICO|nr:ferredoxin reductase family protein [Gulosibacter sediminis]UQN16020.1 ferredoxin reductase family protein [Gulosibacter sediminis]